MTLSSFIRDEQGSSFIELSLILPVLVLMLVSVVDFGLVFSQYMTVIDSTRAAAENATIYGQQVNVTSAKTYATQFAAGIPGYTAAAVLVCTCTPGGTSSSCTANCGGTVTNPLQYVQVTASATLPLIFKVTGFPVSIPVKSVTSIRTPYTQGN